MKRLNFKYYPERLLVTMLCLLIALLLSIKYLILSIIDKQEFSHIPSVNIGIEVFGLAGILIIFFKIWNTNVMFGWFLKLIDIPDLRGSYKGKLVSSFHLDNDPNSPNITKYLQLEITQNLNGFFIKVHFYESEFHSDISSISESISHDIEKKENGEFLIIYRYKNSGNSLHKDHKKYSLNKHEGIALLVFNPKDKTLTGNYFNDSQDRPSYGYINLNKIL